VDEKVRLIPSAGCSVREPREDANYTRFGRIGYQIRAEENVRRGIVGKTGGQADQEKKLGGDEGEVTCVHTA